MKLCIRECLKCMKAQMEEAFDQNKLLTEDQKEHRRGSRTQPATAPIGAPAARTQPYSNTIEVNLLETQRVHHDLVELLDRVQHSMASPLFTLL